MNDATRRPLYRGNGISPVRPMLEPRDFESMDATGLRVFGTVAVFERADGRKVALSYENDLGAYVVWQIAKEGDWYSWSTTDVRRTAAKFAVECAMSKVSIPKGRTQ